MGTIDKQISNVCDFEVISPTEKKNTRKWGMENANMGGVTGFESKPCRNLGGRLKEGQGQRPWGGSMPGTSAESPNQSWQSRDEVRERMELGGQQMHIMLNFDVH